MNYTVLSLGAVAGLTIFLGLPIGRVQNPSVRLKAFLNAAAVGVLLFLFWDVLTKAMEPINDALKAASTGKEEWGSFFGLALTFVLCLGIGLIGLVYYDRWMGRRAKRAATVAADAGMPGHSAGIGPGAMHVTEMQPSRLGLHVPGRRLALLIAVGIGLHNFSEGLAIGQSAANGHLRLAFVLIIGFGLHNATEGFGIVAPMTGLGERPDWSYLLFLGLIAGGPTALGTFLGQSFVNATVFIGFLALAAGSILYVLIQLFGVAARLGHKELMMWGLLLGLTAGFATDFILTAAGA